MVDKLHFSSKEEALKIVKEAAEAGLVHVTMNKAHAGHFICNCCSCCWYQSKDCSQVVWSGVTVSAAAVGVAARRSATMSAIVTSTSCPTAEITGASDAAMARDIAVNAKMRRTGICGAAETLLVVARIEALLIDR